MKKTQQINVKVDEALLSKITKLAKESGMRVATYVRMLLMKGAK